MASQAAPFFMDLKWKPLAAMFVVALVAVALAPRIFDALKGVKSKIEKAV